MILIILIIWQSIRFYRIAKDSGLNPIFWAIAPGLGYFTLAFIIVLLIGIFAPELLDNRLVLLVFELISAIVALGVLNLIITKKAENKRYKKFESNDEIIDQF